MELAMSLHQAHSAMDAEAHGHFDVNSHGVQLHVSPVRRRGYSNVRQPNSRSRRRQRGGGTVFLIFNYFFCIFIF